MRKLQLIVFILVCALSANGCAWFKKEKSAVERPQAPTVSKRAAIDTARAFAEKEGLGDEFRLRKASKIKKYLTLGQDRHYIWQVYFPHESQTIKKFYKKSPLMVEVNAVTREVENWGRR